MRRSAGRWLDRAGLGGGAAAERRSDRSDIPLLADHFGRRMAFELGWEDWPGFTPAVVQRLTGHGWPGNVRQLKNVIERAVYRWGDPSSAVDAIEFDPFASPWLTLPAPPPINTTTTPTPPAEPVAGDFRSTCAAFERRLLEDALTRHRHNQRAAAAGLGLSYDQLRHALRRHSLFPSAARVPA